MSFFITLLLTLLVVIAALIAFRLFGVPTYRLQACNLIALLESVLAAEASEADWEVFSSFPIHTDPRLEELRQRCMILAEREMTCRDDVVFFTENGKQQLKEILEILEREYGNE